MKYCVTYQTWIFRSSSLGFKSNSFTYYPFLDELGAIVFFSFWSFFSFNVIILFKIAVRNTYTRVYYAQQIENNKLSLYLELFNILNLGNKSESFSYYCNGSRISCCIMHPINICSFTFSLSIWASLVAQMAKRLFTMRKTRVRSLGREDPLEKEMATHSSTLAWKIPWLEEPGGLQSMGSQRVRHD